MIIDFYRLLLQLLPLALRNGLANLTEAMAMPLATVYAAIQAWQRDLRLQATSTCQVIYLETMLNYRLLGSFVRTIYITDGDGITADFVINVPPAVTVEYNRLYALVDKYRLYGKRFTVGQAVLTYQFDWIGLVCEKDAQTVTTEWTGLVCEKPWQRLDCVVKIYTPSDMPNKHQVVSDVYVMSTIQALVVYTFGDPSDANEQQEWHTINMGQNASVWIDNPVQDGVELTAIWVSEVTPMSDDYYNYIAAGITN